MINAIAIITDIRLLIAAVVALAIYGLIYHRDEQ